MSFNFLADKMQSTGEGKCKLLVFLSWESHEWFMSVCINIYELPWWHRWWRICLNVGDLASIPGLGRSAAEGDDNPLQYSCLQNSMDRGARMATVHDIPKSQTWLSDEHWLSYLVIYIHTYVCIWVFERKPLKVKRIALPQLHPILYLF